MTNPMVIFDILLAVFGIVGTALLTAIFARLRQIEETAKKNYHAMEEIVKDHNRQTDNAIREIHFGIKELRHDLEIRDAKGANK